MPTESFERKTINLPSSSEQAANRPFWLVDDRAKTALRELQEGELLQLVQEPAPLSKEMSECRAKRLPYCRHRWLIIRKKRFNLSTPTSKLRPTPSANTLPLRRRTPFSSIATQDLVPSFWCGLATIGRLLLNGPMPRGVCGGTWL